MISKLKLAVGLGLIALLSPSLLGISAPARAAMPVLAAGAEVVERDDVYCMVRNAEGLLEVYYTWNGPATVYSVTTEKGKEVRPGREVCMLEIKGRSKAHLTAGATYVPVEVNLWTGQHLDPADARPILVFRPRMMNHDSIVEGEDKDALGTMKEVLTSLGKSTGIYELIVQTPRKWTLGIGRVIMMLVGLLLLYLAIARGFEPLLLLPIGFGAIMSNIPLVNMAGPDGILGMIYGVGIETGVFPLLIFMGVGAMTDFGPLIANPVTALLGAAAQLGIFTALIGALLLTHFIPAIDFGLKDAASIGIIGGADGPTSIFLASKLSPGLLGAIAVAAYSYMALVPIIQPPIMKLLTTKAERKIKMHQLRHVSKLEKVAFPVGITLLCALLLPDAAPLISMLMFGNLMRECGVVERLSSTAQNALINIVTIFLGLAVGSKLSADKFLNLQTIGILLLGLVAFVVGTAGGVLLGKVMCHLSGRKINPLIGAAGVSAVPMAARVVNKVGLEDDPHNFLLMHAMGPNVAGVIGSAVAAGVLLKALDIIQSLGM